MGENQTKNYAFQEMNLSQLRGLRKKLITEDSDAIALAKLNAFAQIKIQTYLKETPELSVTDVTEMFAFVHTFAKENGSLTALGEKAMQVILPKLKAFDEENNLLNLDGLSEKQLLKNISLIEGFEKINPLELTKKGLKYPQFERAFKLLNAIKIHGDDGQDLDESEQISFHETMIDTARLTTYFQLCISKQKITEQDYLTTLCMVLEFDLVTLLTVDKLSKEMPFSSETQEKINQFFEDFLNSLSE